MDSVESIRLATAGFAKLACRFRFEAVPKDITHLYLPGLSETMHASCGLLDLVASMWHSNPALVILANGNNNETSGGKKTAKETGWPGLGWYVMELAKRGVSLGKIFPTEPAFHTRSEASELVRTAKEIGAKRIGILSVPYHWEKFAISLVGAMHEHDYWAGFWFVKSEVPTWHMMIEGSQGQRYNSFLTESGKYVQSFIDYVLKGQVNDTWKRAYGASPEKALEYLDRRDAGLL